MGHSLATIRFSSVAVLCVVCLLILTLPICIGRAHRVARQTQCLNNMAVNLATAHIQFATVNGRFCGYVNSVGPDNKCVSWAVPLFPYFDRGDLAQRWMSEEFEWVDANQTIPAKVKHPHTYIEIMLCPENPPFNEKISPLGFIVNGGYAGDTQPAYEDATCTTTKPGTGENVANGVFHDQYGPGSGEGFNPQIARTVSMKYLNAHDGASNTFLLSENVQWVTTWYTTKEDRAPLAFVWFQNAEDKPQSNAGVRQINVGKEIPTNGRLDFARPSSYHEGGVNVAFCDGHGKFISESIDYRVYKQLMTSASEDSDDCDRLVLDGSEY